MNRARRFSHDENKYLISGSPPIGVAHSPQSDPNNAGGIGTLYQSTARPPDRYPKLTAVCSLDFYLRRRHGAKPRKRIYRSPIAAAAEQAMAAPLERLACAAWDYRILDYKSPMQRSYAGEASTPDVATLKFGVSAATPARR